jgi:hypothetical protein
MMGRKNEKETVELDDGGFFIVISWYPSSSYIMIIHDISW